MSVRYKYSVIIPHKDRPELLRKLISSIPETEQIQVIIVDDHSKNTFIEDIQLAFEERLNIMVLHNENEGSKGAGWARNIGIDYAKGKYLVFADSDDTFKDNAFEIFDAITAKEEYDIVVFKASSTSKDGVKSTRTNFQNFLVEKASIFNEKASNEIKKILSKIDSPWAKLVKTDLVKKNNIRFDEIHYSNDVLFNLRVLIEAQNIKVCTEEVYSVLDHSSSLVKEKSENVLDERFDACIRFNELLSEQKFSENAGSVTGGYIWQARDYGLSKMVRFIWQSLRNNVKIIYPVHRYVRAFFMELSNVDPLIIRFYIVFGIRITK